MFFASQTFETPALGAETTRMRPEARLFDWGPLPPFVYVATQVDKMLFMW